MIPTPGGKSYVMPVGKVMALYRKHTGRQFVRVSGGPPDLDITASRTGNQLFLHVVNTHRTRAQTCHLRIPGFTAQSGKAFEIATAPMAELTSAKEDSMTVRERPLAIQELLTVPAASVTAVEFVTKQT